MGFELAIPESEWQRTRVLARAANGIGQLFYYTTHKINQYIWTVTVTLPLVNGDMVLMSDRVSSVLPTRAGARTRF